MLPNLAGFLQDVDVFLAQLRIGMLRVVLVDQLGKPQGASHACRTTANDDHVSRHLRAFDTFNRLSENHAHKRSAIGETRDFTQSQQSLVRSYQSQLQYLGRGCEKPISRVRMFPRQRECGPNNLLRQWGFAELFSGSLDPGQRIPHTNAAFLHQRESFPNANWREPEI